MRGGDRRSAVFRDAAHALTRAAAVMQLRSEAEPLHAMAQRLHEYADDWGSEEGNAVSGGGVEPLRMEALLRWLADEGHITPVGSRQVMKIVHVWADG